jgi:hypothetical protein
LHISDSVIRAVKFERLKWPLESGERNVEFDGEMYWKATFWKSKE